MRFIYALLLLFSAGTLYGVAPEFWRVSTPEEFLAGEVRGATVTARGDLVGGPSLERVAAFTEPFVLSQAGDGRTLFVGTGNEGKVYRVEGKSAKLLFEAPEPEIYALALSGGRLYVASSPNGKVYRVDPASGRSSVFFDPGAGYIWALQALPDGAVAVATGLEGKLYRVTSDGKAETLFEAPETHIRAIALRPDGSILAGGASEGRIYEVRPGEKGRALFDSALSEISSVYVDANGIGWAAGVTSTLPTAAPQKQEQKQAQSASAGGQQQQSQQQGEPTATVDVSFSFDAQPSAGEPTGNAEVYRIDRDGFVERVRRFDRELVYAIGPSGGDGVYVSTGPLGRVYRLEGGDLALVASTPEKQIVSIAGSGDSIIVTTTNSGAVYRIGGEGSEWEYRSAVHDGKQFSRFGNYRIEGKAVDSKRLGITFRSGNTGTPDDTWSDWTPASGASSGPVAAPAARYLQWRLTGSTRNPASVDAVTVAYMNRNVAPIIDAVVVHDPGAIFLAANYPAPPNVIEATNPDEHGIFTSLDTPQSPAEGGKRFFRKGYRTVAWRATDANNDILRYALAFRPKEAGRWLKLRENIEASQFNFDTSQLPDGIYELRLEASDRIANPEQALADTKEGIEFLVDNTPPRITSVREGSRIVVTVTDSISPVGKVEYAVDAEKWERLVPQDGIADSTKEVFVLDAAKVDGRFVMIRAVDAFYNTTTATVDAGR